MTTTNKPLRNFHLIAVRYIGPANVRGSRVKLTSYRFKQSVTLNFDDIYRDALDQAETYLGSRGFNIIGTVELADGYGLITDTFMALKQVAAA